METPETPAAPGAAAPAPAPPGPPPGPPPGWHWQMAPAVPPGPAPGIAYAGFAVRSVGYLIDNLLLGIVSTAILFVGVMGAVAANLQALCPNGYANGECSFNDASALTADQLAALSAIAVSMLSILAIIVLLSAVYHVVFWAWRGGTPGQLLLGLRVAREEDGGPLGLGRSVVRYLGYILSSLAFGLGFLWVGFDPRKQGWHDKLSGSLVVRRI